jgi:hypothetical protein
MTRTLTALTASVLLVTVGLVQGFWTARWSPSNAANEAAARFGNLPKQIGEWQGEDLDAKITPAMGPISGMMQRRYVNRRTGAALTIALVCGLPGPVSIHSPDVCYGASGYEIGSLTRAKTGASNEFWTADATRTRTTDQTRLRLYWAWNAGQGWTAPDHPRLTFDRRVPVLYKLYVMRQLTGPAGATPDEPCEAFLKVLLPEVERTLIAPGL